MKLASAKSKQPEVNIGMVGHVDHGKTTLTQALSGTWTDTHSEERKRGISITLGYADTSFHVTSDGEHYAKGKHPDGEKGKGDLLRVVSFIDAQGHETLMAVMISGASIRDGALLLVAATEKCPPASDKGASGSPRDSRNQEHRSGPEQDRHCQQGEGYGVLQRDPGVRQRHYC